MICLGVGALQITWVCALYFSWSSSLLHFFAPLQSLGSNDLLCSGWWLGPILLYIIPISYVRHSWSCWMTYTWVNFCNKDQQLTWQTVVPTSKFWVLKMVRVVGAEITLGYKRGLKLQYKKGPRACAISSSINPDICPFSYLKLCQLSFSSHLTSFVSQIEEFELNCIVLYN